MYEIEFHAEASKEMQTAAAYYEEQAKEPGDEFLDEIEQGLRWIRQFPRLWPIYEGEYRRCLLKRFPYYLVYRTASERAFVIAAAHLHRKPGYWTNRGTYG